MNSYQELKSKASKEFAERWNIVSEWVDSQSLLSRLSIITIILLIFHFLWKLYLLDPLRVSEKNVSSDVLNVRGQLHSLSGQLKGVEADLMMDPVEALRIKANELQKEIDEKNKQLDDISKKYISPKEMTRALKDILSEMEGVKIIRVENETVELLNPKTGQTKDKKIYIHGFTIEFSANDDIVIAYLKRLEELDWQLFWASMQSISIGANKSKITLHIDTLSHYVAWMGI